MIKASKIWRSLVAATLVAGTVATMLPQAASAAITAGYVVTLTTAVAGATSGYSFTPVSSIATGTSVVETITFPAGTVGPSTSTTATALTAAQILGTTIQTVQIASATWTASTTAPVLVLTSGTITAVTGGVALATVIPVAASIKNPILTGSYTLTASPSNDPSAVASAAYAVGLVGDSDIVTAVAATPTTPSANASYALSVTTKSNLTAGVSTITLTFSESTNFANTSGYGLPTTIAKANVVISGTTCNFGATDAVGAAVTACTDTAISTTQSPPSDPAVDVQAGTITFTVPDMNPGNSGGSGHNLKAGTVSIGISANAGITNPTGASATKKIWANDSTDPLNQGAVWAFSPLLPRVLQLNAVAGSRGTVVTVNGFGYTGQANVFLDNGVGGGIASDGNQSGTEPILSSNVVVTGGKFSTTITVGASFSPGTASNFVQAIDSAGPQPLQTTCVAAAGTGGCGTRATTFAFSLDPTMSSIAPTSGSVGDTITAQLIDEPAGTCTLTSGTGAVGFTVGGIRVVCAAATTTTISGGVGAQTAASTSLVVVDATKYGPGEFVQITTAGATETELVSAIQLDGLTLTVIRGQLGSTAAIHNGGETVAHLNTGTTTPAANTDGTITYTFKVPTGIKQGTATVSIKGATKTLTVNGATLAVTPTTVVPNQQITISGSGFTGGVDVVKAATFNGVQIGGATQGTTAAPVAPDTKADSGGSIVMQFKLPTTAAGAQTAPGQYAVTVTDNSGNNVSGTALITMATPTLVISPTTGLAGSTISFSGAGMAANSTVTVSYPATGGNTVTSSVQSDASGNYSGTMTIPSSGLVIPSTNTLTATDALITTETASVIHSIPAAALTVSPTSGAPGTSLTISGTSFPIFGSLATLTIGGNGVSVTGVNTDANGAFSTTVLVPGLTAGTATVVATVGTTTANTSITVTAAASTIPATTALAALINTQNLNIVTSFNYGTGAYQAYVPNLGGNTLATISPNTVLFITMTKDTTVIVSGISYAVKANVPTPIGVGAAVSVAVQ